MRKNLKEARQKAGMTQKQVAKYLHIGESLGSIQLWDSLEDLLNVNQRNLREISKTHLGKEDNR